MSANALLYAFATYLMRETFSVSMFVSTSCLFVVSSSVNTAWEREDLQRCQVARKHNASYTHVSFMFVAATVRALLPSSMSVIISS